jgi:hypothetical protein
MTALVFEVLERATARAAEDQARLLSARAEWERLAGTVHHDEPLYEERAAAFLEWFLIDHHASEGEPPPIERMIAHAADERERQALAAIATSHRSLFQVREAHPDGVTLDDLWGGAVFRVHERRRLAGLAPGELFDARLVADVETPLELVFARTFCFHPREAEEACRRLVADARRDREPRDALLFRLLRLRVRCERYRHVAPSRVYASDDTLA